MPFLMRLLAAQRAHSIYWIGQGCWQSVKIACYLLLILRAFFSQAYLVDQFWLKKRVRNKAATSRASTSWTGFEPEN
jgi:hypothetical protein